MMPKQSRITSDVSPEMNQDHNNITSRRFLKFLYLLLLGTPSLERLLEIIEQEDETQWRELKGNLVDRTSNINVVASLALGTCASFLTSNPPTTIMGWNHPFPYLCLVTSSVSSTLAVLSGLGLLAFINTIRPNSIKEMQSNHLKFALTMILLSMPFLCLFMTGLASVTAFLGAAWLGNNTWARTGVTIGFVWFIVMIFAIFGSLY